MSDSPLSSTTSKSRHNLIFHRFFFPVSVLSFHLTHHHQPFPSSFSVCVCPAFIPSPRIFSTLGLRCIKHFLTPTTLSLPFSLTQSPLLPSSHLSLSFLIFPTLHTSFPLYIRNSLVPSLYSSPSPVCRHVCLRASLRIHV